MLTHLLTVPLLAASTAICLVVDHGKTVPKHNVLDDIAPIPGVKFERVTATRPRNPHKAQHPDQHTTNFQRLRGIKNGKGSARSAAAILGAHQRSSGQVEPAYQNITTANEYGMQYALWADIGGVPVELIVDTGSADTWVIG